MDESLNPEADEIIAAQEHLLRKKDAERYSYLRSGMGALYITTGDTNDGTPCGLAGEVADAAVDKARLDTVSAIPDQPGDGEARRPSREFTEGFGFALAWLVRFPDVPTMARELALENGFTYADFEQSGLEDYDLQEIRKALCR